MFSTHPSFSNPQPFLKHLAPCAAVAYSRFGKMGNYKSQVKIGDRVITIDKLEDARYEVGGLRPANFIFQ